MTYQEAIDFLLADEDPVDVIDNEYSKAMAEWFEETIYDACLGG